VQEAIAGASALLVVLSRVSVTSEWCKRELNADLVKELEERRVVVMPILVQNCDVLLFLREKLYADLRSDFNDWLTSVLEVIVAVTNHATPRIDEPECHTYWSIDWEELGG
jgi:hypothetical protein